MRLLIGPLCCQKGRFAEDLAGSSISLLGAKRPDRSRPASKFMRHKKPYPPPWNDRFREAAAYGG